MSTSNKSGSSEFDLDLDLHFLPAWAQRSSTENKYAKYEGREESPDRQGDRRDRRGPREFRRDGPPRERRFDGGRSPRREGGRPPFQKGGWREQPRDEHREPLPPPVQLEVNLVPEEKGVEALARQIRLTGRAYPLFDIGFLILKKPDRYDVQFGLMKGADGKPLQPLFVCDLDESLWLSEQEAADHALSKHFSTFYQTEKIPTDPPKGVYTFVAQCGMSGIILGPPNYHDYQNKLRKLHQERFARMPFEAFKSRVKIVKDEVVVKKWIEEQSFRLEYTCLNVPETIKLNSREEVEKHFRETHLANVIKPIDRKVMNGSAAQNQPNRVLRSLVRHAWEEQNRFPLKLVNVLSHQFASHGLHFFKINKNVTHVSMARPRYLDLEATPVSENLRRLVEFIRNTPRCTRRKLLESLAPAASEPSKITPAPSESTPVAAADGQATSASETQTAPASQNSGGTTAADAINSDLHWLIHEGHVIEFANGILEAARKPLPKPPKPEKKSVEPAARPEPVQAIEQVQSDSLGESGIATENSVVEPSFSTPETNHEQPEPVTEAVASIDSPSANISADISVSESDSPLGSPEKTKPDLAQAPLQVS